MLASEVCVSAARDVFRSSAAESVVLECEAKVEFRSGLDADVDGLRRAREKEGLPLSFVEVRVVVVVDAMVAFFFVPFSQAPFVRVAAPEIQGRKPLEIRKLGC